MNFNLYTIYIFIKKNIYLFPKNRYKRKIITNRLQNYLNIY